MSAWGIGSSLLQISRSHGDSVAARTLSADGKRIEEEITWAKLHTDVGVLSRLLTNVSALRPGDRLGVLGRNSVEYLKLMYASVKAGLVFVPLNTRWSVGELRSAITDGGIIVLAVIDHEFLDLVMDLSQLREPGGPAVSWLITGPRATLDPSTAPSGAMKWQVTPLGASDDASDNRIAWRNTSVVDEGVVSAAPGGQDRRRDAAEIVGHALVEHGGIDTGDVFCIVYTSGTTGRPKGVALTHLGQVTQAMGKCLHAGYTCSTAFLSVVPFFHVGGISSSLALTMVGGCHVFLPRFIPASASAAVQTGGVNTLVVVPTMLDMILKVNSDARWTSTDGNPTASNCTAPSLLSVRTVVVGGQPLSRRLQRLARLRMPHASLIQTYACTEAGSSITFAAYPSPASQGPPRETSATAVAGEYSTIVGDVEGVRRREAFALNGRPALHVEVRVVERGLPNTTPARCCPSGVVGEIETRGPHVMKGYWGRPELTCEVLRPDGWLRTGDLGRLDERTGYLVFVGRAKDVIKTGGESVYASEVEGVLLRHDWVVEAAVYGLEDERLGEKVAASVVLSDSAHDEVGTISRDRARTVLNEFCGLHLSHYKRPRRIDVVPALPKNSSGKVLRHRLRASL